MLIESIIKRANGTHVKLGDDIYHFSTHIKGDPRHICEVNDDDHIQAFLAVKEGYRIAKLPKKGEATQADAAAAQNAVAKKAVADAAAQEGKGK